MSSPGHEWAPHEREGWSVCSRCGMVRNYDREPTTCRGALPKIRQRSEIVDCGQDGVCENEVLRSNSNHLCAENASLARQVDSMAMRIESLAEELAKPEDVRLREVLDALGGRAVIFDGLGARVGHLLDELDEWIGRAGEAERLAEERLAHATMAGVVPVESNECEGGHRADPMTRPSQSPWPPRQSRVYAEDGSGPWCDKAWHGETRVPAATMLRCASCETVYARCEQCERYRPSNAAASMRAHVSTAHRGRLPCSYCGRPRGSADCQRMHP